MKLIFGQDAAIAEWVARRIPHMSVDGKFTAIGVADGAKPVAGILYNAHDTTFDTLMISAAADTPRWAQRGVLLAIFHYPFEQLNVRKLWAVIASSNKPSIRLTTGLGFRQEAILSRHFGKDHAVVLRMFCGDYENFKQRMAGNGSLNRRQEGRQQRTDAA